MHVPESIAELRKICHEGRESEFVHSGINWWDKQIRKVSIYFTKLSLQMGISANQATTISFVLGLAAMVLLIFPSPISWFIAVALLTLSVVFDQVDGGIARYKKTSSLEGAFWDGISGDIIWGGMLICISFGIYNTLYSVYPLIFGFIAAVSFYLAAHATMQPYSILHERGILAESLSTDEPAQPEEPQSIIIRCGRFLSYFQTLLFGLLLSTIIDCFVSPFAIGFLSFNARYIWFIIYTLVWVAIVIRSIYRPLRTGVRLRP